MRQGRWLELLKDYDFELSFLPGKANVVTDAMSRKSLHLSTHMVEEMELIKQFWDNSLVCEVTHDIVKLGMLKLTSQVLEEIKEGQKTDLELIDCLTLINDGQEVNFKIDENEITKFWDRVCVSNIPELKQSIFEEGHKSILSIHPRATKMYQDLKEIALVKVTWGGPAKGSVTWEL
jgi:hypothetical protein